MSRPRAALALLVAADAAVFAWLACRRHDAFETGRFDLGNMVQAVWSTAHGRPLEATDLHGEQFVRLGAHFDPLLVALAPLWRVWPDPKLLLVVQAAALALGAVPVFRLARRRLGSDGAGLAFAAVYLLYAPVQWLALADFHAVALATPLLLAAFDFLDERRLVPFALCAAAACLAKEHVGLVVAAFGVWYALARGARKEGAAIALAGGAVSALAVLVVIPAFAPAGESAFAGRYDDPLLDARDAGYLARLLLPLAALPLLAPLAALTALPEVALNVLSSVRTQTSLHYHYTAATVPGLVAAAVLGAARLRGGAVLALVAAVAGAIVLGAIPLWEPLVRDAIRVTPHDRVAARGLALIPPDATVSATNTLGAHLSERRRVLSFPLVADAEWVAVDRTRPSLGDRLGAPLGPALTRLAADPRWRTVFAEDGVLVFRRSG